jgi:7,8-dihydropterin-6-yl-methyl-4-(beta-D-ribofuranosyl)aminobenzene 5'-phosphate synthase
MTYSLHPVDHVDVTVLVDNYTDLLMVEQNSLIRRPLLSDGKTLLAEHGLSFLIQVRSGEKIHTILMDAGATETALIEKAKTLGISREEIMKCHQSMDISIISVLSFAFFVSHHVVFRSISTRQHLP